MLVLSRRVEESILIGPGVEVKILGVRRAGDQVIVRLGISAPRDVPVYRAEVLRAVEAENQAAASADLEFLSRWVLDGAAETKLPDSGNG